MKSLLILLLFSCFLNLSSAATTDRVLHIFLVGGQSNAVGQDSAKNIPPAMRKPLDEVPFYYAVVPHKGGATREPVYTTLRPGASHVEDGVGPEISFGYALEEHFGKTSPMDRVAIIKFAHGGTNLFEQWKAGGDSTTKGDGRVYREFQRVIGLGLEALKEDQELEGYEHRIEAMLWVQGESDLSNGHASDYAENLTAFIADIRATYRKDLRFYFTRISNSQTIYSESKDAEVVTSYGAIRKEQEEVGEKVERARMIDIDGQRFSMLAQSHYRPFLLHFDAKGTLAIGEAFADAVIGDLKAEK